MSSGLSPLFDAVEHDNYDELLASVRAQFRLITQGQYDKVHLYTTRTPELYTLFLSALPPALRQVNTCSTCRHFMRRYSGLVAVNSDGKSSPAMWNPETTPEPYTNASRALANAVSAAPIEGVFLSQEGLGASRKRALGRTWRCPLLSRND